ncbi:MAG: hypothetical protein ACTSWU_00115 [Candidatus Thorarchaeota archaeon]
MSKMTKTFNWVLGGIRMFIGSLFTTIFLIILLPTIVTLAEVLSFGVWMLFNGNFYLLVGFIVTLVSVGQLLAKFVIPDLPSGE